MMMSFRGGVFKERKKKFLSALESSSSSSSFSSSKGREKSQRSRASSSSSSSSSRFHAEKSRRSVVSLTPFTRKRERKGRRLWKKKKKKKTHTQNRGCFLVFFFASFLLFLAKRRPKSYLFRSLNNVIQKTKRDCLGYRFFFFLLGLSMIIRRPKLTFSFITTKKTGDGEDAATTTSCLPKSRTIVQVGRGGDDGVCRPGVRGQRVHL